ASHDPTKLSRAFNNENDLLPPSSRRLTPAYAIPILRHLRFGAGVPGALGESECRIINQQKNASDRVRKDALLIEAIDRRSGLISRSSGRPSNRVRARTCRTCFLRSSQ